MFRRKNKKQAEPAPAPVEVVEPAPVAEEPAAATEAQQSGDMFSGMESAPNQGSDMFGGMNSTQAQGGDMFSSGMKNLNPAPIPSPVSTPAAPPDPLMGARQKLMQISNQLRSEISRLNEGEHKMREYIKSIETAISQLEDKLVAAEADEASAIAVEDYGRAEVTSKQITAIKSELEAKHTEIVQCMQRNGQATQIRVTKIQSELVTIDQMIQSFDGAYTHINGQYLAYAKSLDDQSAAHDARLATMQEAITKREEALAVSREAIAVEREEVEKLVHEDCIEFFHEKEDASALKLTLDSEIAALKEQLHQKNQEMLVCGKRIADADQKIQQVRVRFLPQFKPVEEKNKGLMGEAKTIESMKGQYATAASRVEMVKKTAEDDKSQKKEIVDTRKDELDVITFLANALKAYDQKIMDTFQMLMQKQMTMYTTKKSLEEDCIHSKGITNRIAVLENIIKESKVIVDENMQKMPDLQQQKDDAVSTKNYKMAGQLTSQIKQMQSKKEAAAADQAAAEEELAVIKESSGAELVALEAKRNAFDAINKDYLLYYYDILRSNVLACRSASRAIENITRGDDTFRFACQALSSVLYEITNAELEPLSLQLGMPELGEEENIATETVTETPAVAEIEKKESLFDMETAPVNDGMFDMKEAPAEDEGLTAECALKVMEVVKAMLEAKASELDKAMEDEKYDECDQLSKESQELEKYEAELKQYAEGETTEVPSAPSCFDPNFKKVDEVDDFFGGM